METQNSIGVEGLRAEREVSSGVLVKWDHTMDGMRRFAGFF
jgi:hypothetical protein